MATGRPENLIPANKRSKEEASANGRKGGIISGEVRRAKKTMREMLEILMEQTVERDGKQVTRNEVMMAKMIERAMGGNIKAAEFVRDTSGQKPDQVVAVKEIKTIPFEIDDD